MSYVVGVVSVVGVMLSALMPAYPSSAETAAQTVAVDKPNVLIIVTDDQRLDQMRVMPNTRELLGDAGVTFLNAVATTPSCCPSRASIFSGRYIHNHGVTNVRASDKLDTSKTAQRVLRDHGYFTGLSGKYLNHWWEAMEAPRDFDRYATFARKSTYYNNDILINGNLSQVNMHSTAYFARIARRFLNAFDTQDDARPWLLYYTPFSPHIGAVARPKNRSARVPRYKPPPSMSDDTPWMEDQGEQLRTRTRMMRSVMDVDDMVAYLMKALRDLGELENTLILFTSDNGYMFGEHQLTRKGWPYNESVRVPMLLRFDAVGVRGKRGDVVANIDIAPTIYQAAGVDAPYPVDGRSLLADSPREHGVLIESTRPSTPNMPLWLGLWTPGETFFHLPELGINEFYEQDDRWQIRNVYEQCSGDDCVDPTPFLQRLEAWARCEGENCP